MDNPSDVSHPTIQKLFYKNIRSLSVNNTLNDRMRSFDYQFSDGWL